MLGSCGETNSSMSPRKNLLSYEPNAPLGAMGGFRWCNGSYDTTPREFIIQYVINN